VLSLTAVKHSLQIARSPYWLVTSFGSPYLNPTTTEISLFGAVAVAIVFLQILVLLPVIIPV
jgi:hypothetical protein